MIASSKLALLAAVSSGLFVATEAFSADNKIANRRDAIGWMAGGAAGFVLSQPSFANTDIPDSYIDNYLRTGLVSQPMGVSGQAGKSRPETGILIRDGSEVSRDPRTGDVLAEIVMMSPSGSEDVPILVSFSSPWPLATGSVYDIECRDASSGDGAFLAATSKIGNKKLSDLKDSFFLNEVFSSTGRFSFYGEPTDIKLRDSQMQGKNNKYRVMDVSFATLSQSTMTEIPRSARIVATIPEGTDQAVMLVGSASASRWKKGTEQQVAKIGDSFRATPAPQTSLKVRSAKERRGES